MGAKSAIDYVDATWNPWQGCHPVSEGCEHCYMYREKRRFGQDPATVVRSSDKTFDAPLSWKEPRRIFVCSWSDFWLEEADNWRYRAFNIMAEAAQHEYVIITKRPERMVGWMNAWANRTTLGLPRIYWGITAENQPNLYDRWKHLVKMGGLGKLLISVEPMLGELNLGLCHKCQVDPEKCYEHRKISGVICGCESGPGAREMKIEWARDMLSQCREARVPFFMKQMVVNGKLTRNIDEFPEDLRVREWPSWQG